MTEKEKNPPLSGNSEEGTATTDAYSIPQHYGKFNSSSKFSLSYLKNVKGSNGQYTALCPAHDDRNSSLSVKITGDKVLLHCHAGCATERIIEALGLNMSALFMDELPKPAPAPNPNPKPRQTNTVTYEYLNPDGTVAYRKSRYEYSDGSKTFAFYHPDGRKGAVGLRRVPFNLPGVIAANTVYFVEGEKAAAAVIRAGYTATSLDAGANSKWLPEYADYFRGKTVVVLPDNDAPGMKYARSIVKHLPGAGIKLLPNLPEKGDVFDWLAAGRTMEEIENLPYEEPEDWRDDMPVINNGLFEVGFLPDEPGFVPINPFDTKSVRNRYRWNDIGISNLFADCYKNVSRYVPEANGWYVYNGRMWKYDVGNVKVAGQAKKFMYYLLISCQSYISDDDTRNQWVEFVTKRMRKQARDAMIADAASVWPVSILQFDQDPYIFNCQNCTIELKSFTVRGHSPEDYLSKISNVVYDADAVCQRWELFISEIMQGDEELAKFLQKALGYSLTGDTSEECFFILYGSTTRNGKGTTMETVLRLLGDYGRTAQPETIAQKQTSYGGAPTEDIARLKGARFVNISEPDKGLRLNAALVKQVTGGDTLTARFLHQNSFEYRPEYKLFINTNHLPRVLDDSIFASGRVKLIPFERHFEPEEQDKSLKAFLKQPQNISGIFNWLAEGLRLMRMEGLDQPEAVRAATNRYREESDIIGQFVSECLTRCDGYKLKTKDAYSAYERFCGSYGYRPMSIQTLVGELRRRGYVSERRDRTLGTIIEHYVLAEEVHGGD